MTFRHPQGRSGRFRRRSAALVLLTALALPGSGVSVQAAAQPAGTGFERSALSIRTQSGAVHKFRVEIARTAQQQALGLMYRRRMAADAGMLFLHRRPGPARMWMKNTYIPLDMLFVGADGRIVDMKQRTVPGSLAVIASRKSVVAVLELNAGTVSRLGIAIGDRLDHPAFRAPE